ncbi:MAG TPA: hypothetical protein VFE61_18010 [Candidatus Sulfotelmatobacter sp.]|nr:hypothetical protein [Candidatus Sulfotelmatobacter sp.]
MRDPYQVLHEKQMEVLRLRKETAALRLVLSMLDDENKEEADMNNTASPISMVPNRVD